MPPEEQLALAALYHSKNQKAAKDLLRFMHTKANYEQWFETGQGFYTPATSGWETHKVWSANPVMAPFGLIGKTGLAAGYPGESNAMAAEVLSKYLIGNMFAAAVKGQSAEDAVKACEAQLKSIYGS